MTQRRLPRAMLALVMTALWWPSSFARGQNIAAVERDFIDIEARTQQLSRAKLRANQLRSPTYVEERLTDGELFYRLRDYVRASIIFTDIVENHKNHRAFPDALFLLGESLFRAGDYLGARSRFRIVLSRGDESSFRPFVQRSLGRLIEIAIHTRDFTGVDEYFDRLSEISGGQWEEITQYSKGKYLYSKAVPPESDDMTERTSVHIDQQVLDQSLAAFTAIPEKSKYYPQALYFIGVIQTLKREFPKAIDSFRKIQKAKIKTPEHREIAEMANLALGRLYYETDRLAKAIETYEAVPRSSNHFDAALYEIAWVYIREGDSIRAERALEVLSVAVPESEYIPDARVLRGNLLLRHGRLDEAKAVFKKVAQEFGPVLKAFRSVTADYADARAQIQRIIRDNMEAFDIDTVVPEPATSWAKGNEEMDHAISILSDLSQARNMVRETGELIQHLSAAISPGSRKHMYADLRLYRQRAISLYNRLAKGRRELALAENERFGGGSTELAEVRRKRRSIERFLGRMPVSEEDFTARNEKVLERYRQQAVRLQDLELQLTGVEARIVALERFMADSERHGQGHQATYENVRRELMAHKDSANAFREAIEELRTAVDQGKLQVGVGDPSYERDQKLREDYNALVAEEHRLLASMGKSIPRVDRLLNKASRIENMLDSKLSEIDSVLEERVAELKEKLDQEAINIEGYRNRLASLDDETNSLVTDVVFSNVDALRQRFYDVLLRADVGRVDVAWAVREEHRGRAEMLNKERAQQLRMIDDEFRQIMDETTGGAGE